MQGSDRTQRDDTRGRPTHLGRMPSVAPIMSIRVPSCAWLATPRYASADERVPAKLASRVSAGGGQLRDATIASRIRAALVAERGLASDNIDAQVHDRASPRKTDGLRRSIGPIRRRIRRSG